MNEIGRKSNATASYFKEHIVVRVSQHRCAKSQQLRPWTRLQDTNIFWALKAPFYKKRQNFQETERNWTEVSSSIQTCRSPEDSDNRIRRLSFQDTFHRSGTQPKKIRSKLNI